ncbi:response regulator [Sphingomonas populi]|uniref:Response regulator n=1 Tax=Sphingomonas populi TaxID=2484750 RepID=A0A4Q6Y6T9_9SPHN|nr:response regulator [Sphingomonas populi]RZF65694.1 response regulator [Sphingomonas populi]
MVRYKTPENFQARFVMKDKLLAFFRTNEELSAYERQAALSRGVSERRRKLSIAVIDDEPFKPQMNLESYGYSFTLLGDLRSVEQVRQFPLILCDIVGVGRHFDAIKQGASIISEIKNNYPEKVVVAYTGNVTADPAVRAAIERADAIIQKDIDIEDWISELDRLAILATNPFLVWERVRRRMIDIHVNTRDILLLEDSYVRSIQQRDFNLLHFQNLATRARIGDAARNIALNLVASYMFAALSH